LLTAARGAAAAYPETAGLSGRALKSGTNPCYNPPTTQEGKMNNPERSSDLELIKIRLETAATDLRLKQAELRQKEGDNEPRSWLAMGMRNQAIFAAFIAAVIALLGTLGASTVTYVNARLQLQADVKNKADQLALEKQKAEWQKELDEMRHEASLITNAIQRGGGNIHEIAENLCFLLQMGLLPRAHTQSKLQYFLEDQLKFTGGQLAPSKQCRPMI
jgi:hypothetical protein